MLRAFKRLNTLRHQVRTALHDNLQAVARVVRRHPAIIPVTQTSSNATRVTLRAWPDGRVEERR